MVVDVQPATPGQGPLGPGRRYDWRTPAKFFEKLDAEFHFQLDACSDAPLRPDIRFYGPWMDGLFQPWAPGPVFLNPPYGRELPAWLDRAVQYSTSAAQVTTVALVPARTDTKWWHELVLPWASEIRCIRGRLKFDDSDGNPPFSSVVVIFRPQLVYGSPYMRAMR